MEPIKVELDQHVSAELKRAIANDCPALSAEQVERLSPAISAMVKHYPLHQQRAMSHIGAICALVAKCGSAEEELIAIAIFQKDWKDEGDRPS